MQMRLKIAEPLKFAGRLRLSLGLLVSLATLMVASPVSLAAPAASGSRPNIVFMLTDDMGWSEPGFHGGNEALTPNLDKLAEQGMELTQSYVHAACSPTRAAFLTGRYAFRTGMDWRSEDFGKPSFLRRLGMRLPLNDEGVPTRRIHALPAEARTLAEALKQADYFTSIVGKWHLGEWYERHLPMAQGFMHQYGHYGWGVGYYNKMIPHNAPARFAVYDWHRNQKPLQEEGYSTDLIAAEAERVIAKQSDDKPFFLYVPFNAVHGPIGKVPRYTDQYSPREAALKCLDDAVGRIMTALKKHGFSEDTLVVFINDNGGLTDEINDPYRGTKNTNYEGGVRVPTVVRWPGRIEAGSSHDGMAFIADWYATFVSLAGGEIKDNQSLDSHNLSDMLLNGEASPRDQIIFEVAGSVRPPAIRRGDYKLVGGELYNIAEDPYETNNIASEQPKRVERLRSRLKQAAKTRRDPAQNAPLMDPPLPYVYGKQENSDPPQWLIEKVEARRLDQAGDWSEAQTPWPQAP